MFGQLVILRLGCSALSSRSGFARAGLVLVVLALTAPAQSAFAQAELIERLHDVTRGAAQAASTIAPRDAAREPFIEDLGVPSVFAGTAATRHTSSMTARAVGRA